MTTIACAPQPGSDSSSPACSPPRAPKALEREVTGGIDTHTDTHTAAAVDSAGRMLGSEQFGATAPRYRALLDWLRGVGVLVRHRVRRWAAA